MAYTHYFWNLKTVKPQNCLMPGLIFTMTFYKISSLEKRLRALFLGARHHTQHTHLSCQTASQSLLSAAPDQHHSAYLHSLSHTMTGGTICHFSSCFLCISPVRLKHACRVTGASFWTLHGPHQDKEHFQPRVNLLYYFFWPLFPRLWPPLGFVPKDTFFSERCRQQCLVFPFLCRSGSGLEMIRGD